LTDLMTYGVLHLFAGIGGAALGMQEAESEYRGIRGNFTTLAGIDCDPEACKDFENLTGAPAAQMDLFSREDYIAFHGQEPPENWREVTPADLLKATGGIAPDVIFTSPPCKGFSGLLPTKSAKSQKYQALNRLTVRGLKLALEAYCDDLPGIILLENVPRITSRGAALLDEIKALLGAHGYLFHEGSHDCGTIGGLGQHRKRYLLIARLPAKVASFVYQPPQLRVRSIGEIIGPLPMPDDQAGGVMHRLPRLQWKTWVRLALIPAGGDWRDLEKIAPEQYRLEHVPRSGAFGVQDWDGAANTVTAADGPNNATVSVADPRLGHEPREGVYKVQRFDEPSTTVTGAAKVGTSNGATCIADPRLPDRDNRHPGVYRVVRFDEPGPCVTGTRFGSGAPAIADNRIGGGYSNKRKVLEWNEPATTVTGTPDIQSGAQSIADPRTGFKDSTHHAIYRVGKWEAPARTITGAMRPNNGAPVIADPRLNARKNRRSNSHTVRPWDGQAHTITGEDSVGSGAQSIADPRLGCSCRNGLYGVQDWGEPANTVTGARNLHSGTAAVADLRIPADTEQGTWIIIAEDGTWHRPLSTWELMALQGFPLYMADGSPVVLAGNSDARWRERIGNAVPPPAAMAIAKQMLRTLLVSQEGHWEMSATPIWVRERVDINGTGA